MPLNISHQNPEAVPEHGVGNSAGVDVLEAVVPKADVYYDSTNHLIRLLVPKRNGDRFQRVKPYASTAGVLNVPAGKRWMILAAQIVTVALGAMANAFLTLGASSSKTALHPAGNVAITSVVSPAASTTLPVTVNPTLLEWIQEGSQIVMVVALGGALPAGDEFSVLVVEEDV